MVILYTQILLRGLLEVHFACWGRFSIGSRQPARPFLGRQKLRFVFFERAIFEMSWSSAAPTLRFLAVSHCYLGARPPAHSGDLELTGTKTKASLAWT